MTTNSNTNVVIRQFSGIPYFYSFFNSSGSILLHIQYLISLAYLSKMNLNFDILHNIYELRKLININNVYDLFPNKTVEIVNNNLYLLGIQIARLSQENETIVRNSRYVEELLYFGPYLKPNCKDAHYHSEITVLKAKNYDHLIVAFPGVSSSDSLTAELRTVFSNYTTDLTKFPGLSGLLDANGDVIKDVFFIRSFIPFITHDDDDNCLDATEDTILTQYIVNETECLFTGYSSGSPKALVKGILYAGLMIENSNPKLIEYNIRFGDPECQIIMMRLKNDLLDLIEASIDKKLKRKKITWTKEKAITIVAASKGYPGNYKKFKEIKNIKKIKLNKKKQLFHASTIKKNNKYFSSGGRVLNSTVLNKNLKVARSQALKILDNLDWENKYYRRDIGYQVIDK